MKQFFYTIVFAIITFGAKAQEGKSLVAENLQLNKVGNSMVVTWTESTSSEGSWEVQASADGEKFETIGLVWGADPKAAGNNSYAFKQDLKKVQSKYTHFRVLYTEGSATVKASKTVEFSK